jgi:hypothetical protein
MLDNDVIEAVNDPTPWVSPIVPIRKENGTVRVCTDAKLFNIAITREVHTCPTIEQIALEFIYLFILFMLANVTASSH